MPLILHATLVYTSSALPIFVVFSLTPGTLHTYNLRWRYACVCRLAFSHANLPSFPRQQRLRREELDRWREALYKSPVHVIDETNKMPHITVCFISMTAYDRNLCETREIFRGFAAIAVTELLRISIPSHNGEDASAGSLANSMAKFNNGSLSGCPARLGGSQRSLTTRLVYLKGTKDRRGCETNTRWGSPTPLAENPCRHGKSWCCVCRRDLPAE